MPLSEAWRTQPAATPNQIVAYNLKAARELRGWTQAEAAERLEHYLGWRWTTSSFSDAERSFDHTHRPRAFDAAEIVAFALTFDLPAEWFLLPPPADEGEPYEVIGALTLTPGEDEPRHPYEMDSAEFVSQVHSLARFEAAGPHEQRVSQLLGKGKALDQVRRLVGEVDQQVVTTLHSHIAALSKALEELARLERQLNPTTPESPAGTRRKRGQP